LFAADPRFVRQQFEAFGERLMPVLAEPEVMEIHNIVKR
jgi:hypothetical protein